MNNRFIKWYIPNSQQAGFRQKQGCLFQMFTIFLMMGLANHHNKSLLIGFMDYEKAFDFTNRIDIINYLLKKGAGKVFVQSVANMYDKTYYIPNINKNNYGEAISTQHGVTQGRKTLANFFSFNISDISSVISVKSTFLKNINLLQLADDTSMLVETLREIFTQVLAYSKRKFMVANLKRTFYMEMCKHPVNIPLTIDDDITINPAENGKYTYLGMLFISTNEFGDIIEENLKQRSFHIKKYFDWLEINDNTPIRIKLQVLMYVSCISVWC